MIIRNATDADAANLAAFGARTFAATFAPHNTAEDLAAFLGTAYGEAQQRREIGDPSFINLLCEDGSLVGFAQLRRGPAPACVTGESPIEILRFYVDPALHGRGIAARLMDAALSAAHDSGARTIWLGVWERNARAIAFYLKYGFVHVGDQPFLLGSDLQTDWVMVRAVAS